MKSKIVNAAILLLLFSFHFLAVVSVHASLKQVFVDGKAGRFQQAKSELKRLSNDLEEQSTSADFEIVGRNCAAIGFYSMLSQVSSDCISNKFDTNYGKKLFAAAQKAAVGQLGESALLAKEVADANPDYPQAHLLIARLRMMECMQGNRSCDEVVGMFQNIIRLDTTMTAAYLDLGMLFQDLGKNQESISIWEKAITTAPGETGTKWIHLMLAFVYGMEEQWTKASDHGEKARDMGLSGFVTDLLDEIQSKIQADSVSIEQKSSIESEDEGKVIETVGKHDPDPDFMTGLGHGITYPLRLFGLFNLELVEKDRRTDGYGVGLVVGCLILLSIGIGAFKGKR